MITPRMLHLDAAMLLKGGTAILTDIQEDYEYVNDKRTDKIIGTKYHVALPRLNYEKLAVKIADTTPTITKEDLKAAEVQGRNVEVTFDNLDVSFYQEKRTNDYVATAKADKIIRKDAKQ